MDALIDNFKNNISKLGYELYRNHHIFEHNRTILHDCDICTNKEAFDINLHNLRQSAIDKPFVKSYETFFESIYLDENFMKKLFGKPEFIDAYCKSVAEIKEYKDFATYPEDGTFDDFKQRAYNIYHRYYNYDDSYGYFIESVYPNEEFMRKLLREDTLIGKYLESLKAPGQADKTTIQTVNNPGVKTNNINNELNNIRHLAYELYKIGYMSDIPCPQQLDAQRNYIRYLADNSDTNFDDYIADHGYPDAQTPFKSYNSFVRDIYFSDQYYIRNLLHDKDLIDLYRKDIESKMRLPDAENIRELIQTATTEINKLDNYYLHGKPDRPSDLMKCGYIDGEYAVWNKVLYILKPM